MPEVGDTIELCLQRSETTKRGREKRWRLNHHILNASNVIVSVLHTIARRQGERVADFSATRVGWQFC